ncbi:MAG TPA: hypothetical protein VGB14_06025 [Acidimicrobiales bacterium]
MTTRPDSAHPLDADLLDYVEGVAERASADAIEAHLRGCVVCRIKRQRLTGVPPMHFVDPSTVVVPNFTPLATEAVSADDAQPGELWLTTGEEAAIVLVRSIQRSGDGVVVVPVAFDIEVADEGTLVLDETASPLSVPLAIWVTLLVSLPSTALAERLVTSSDVNLVGIEPDGEHIWRGTPLEGPTDPRHEVRQHLVDRLAALDSYDDEPEDDDSESTSDSLCATVRTELSWRRPWCDVQRLTSLPVPDELAETWIGVCRVTDFTTQVAVVRMPERLSTQRDVDHAQALLVRLNASSLAICISPGDSVDLYDAPSLFGATYLPAGDRSSGPLLTGFSLVDTLDKYLEQKRLPLSVIAGPAHLAPYVDVRAVLASAVDTSANDAISRASRFGEDKRAGYRQLGALKAKLAGTLHRALEPDFDPAVIEALLEEDQR